MRRNPSTRNCAIRLLESQLAMADELNLLIFVFDLQQQSISNIFIGHTQLVRRSVLLLIAHWNGCHNTSSETIRHYTRGDERFYQKKSSKHANAHCAHFIGQSIQRCIIHRQLASQTYFHFCFSYLNPTIQRMRAIE